MYMHVCMHYAWVCSKVIGNGVAGKAMATPLLLVTRRLCLCLHGQRNWSTASSYSTDQYFASLLADFSELSSGLERSRACSRKFSQSWPTDIIMYRQLRERSAVRGDPRQREWPHHSQSASNGPMLALSLHIVESIDSLSYLFLIIVMYSIKLHLSPGQTCRPNHLAHIHNMHLEVGLTRAMISRPINHVLNSEK